MFWSTNFLAFLYYLIIQVASERPTTSGSPAPTPSSIVDILSSQVEYSYFLRHLQRNDMIPVLNSLSNVTLLAPVNLAFTSESDTDIDKKLPYDNNMLLRYIIDQRFRVGYLGTEKVIYNTLYNVEGSPYPVTVSPDFELAEYLIDDTAAIIEVDIHAKHQDSFVQGIDSLLPIKPTLCEVLMSVDDDDVNLGPRLISYMKLLFHQLFGQNEEATETEYNNHAKTIGNKRKSLPSLPQSCEELMSRTKTMLMLSDTYISESLPKTTHRYLLSLNKPLDEKKYSMTKEAILEVKSDIVNFLETLMIDELIGGVNGTPGEYPSINGKSEFNVSLKEKTGQLVLNNKIPSVINATSLAFSDAILHVFDIQDQTYQNFFEDLNIPLVVVIPRKALYALQFSNFVKELNFRSLHHLIDGSTSNQTILVDSAQRDRVVDNDFFPSDFESSYFNYRDTLYYQFTDQMIDIENIMESSEYANFYKLLDSKLCSKNKMGSCFKTKFSASYNADLKKIDATINDEINIMLPGMKTENSNVIYLTKREIFPPSSLKQTLLKLLSNGGVSRHSEIFEIDRRSFLSTLRYLEQFDLLSLAENQNGYSIFLPCGYVEQENRGNLRQKKRKIDEPWKSMGLVLKFLESNPEYFKDLLKGLFIENTIYSDFGIDEHENLTVYKSLRGDIVNVGSTYLDNDYNHVLLNHTELLLPLNSDILFNQGIIHIINEILLPESFRISFSDLIKTTEDPIYQHFSFINLISAYPKLSNALGISNESIIPTYSLLVPSPDSLKDFNITSGFTKLWNFLEFHLIPNTELDKLFTCINTEVFPTDDLFNHDSVEYSIKTNISDAVLSCLRNPYTDKVFLRLRPANIARDDTLDRMSYNKDREVRILSHGCTSMHTNGSLSDGACVFLIDKPLNLDWLEEPNKNTFLHIHIGLISVGIGIILGLLLFGLVVLTVIMCIGRSKTDLLPLLPPASNESMPGENDLNYMRIQPVEDNNVYDRGYETDDDLYAEGDQLLPLYGKKPRQTKYGSISNNESTKIAPLSIKGNNITKALNRERNLPGGF